MNTLPSPPKNSLGSELNPITEELPAYWSLLAPAFALLGGLFSIIGAFCTELTSGGFLVVFVGAPIIEECLKPCGVYLLQAKWPKALRSQSYTALLTALSGLTFALVENVVYLKVYIPDADLRLIIWRYTIGLTMHTVASFIFGFGINQKLIAGVKGEIKFLSTGKRFFFSAMILHSLYNILVTVFATQLGFE